MKIVKPETQGFSSERKNRINAVMQRYVDEKKIAGVVSLIARHGDIVHFEKVGMADIEFGRKLWLGRGSQYEFLDRSSRGADRHSDAAVHALRYLPDCSRFP